MKRSSDLSERLAPKKRFGQHFLRSEKAIARIVEAAHIKAGDTVLEIGPGEGVLTKALLEGGAYVIAVEKDRDAVAFLERTFQEEIQNGDLEIHQGDIRDFPRTKLSGAYKLVANIPYYITGDLLRRFLSEGPRPRVIVFLLQKEVAERIARATKESILSLSVKAYGLPRYVETVPRGAFYPQPKVDSAILSITDISTEHFGAHSEERFFELVKAGFASKRKQLLGNLKAAYPHAEAALAACGLLKSVRAEDVPLDLWFCLLDNLD